MAGIPQDDTQNGSGSGLGARQVYPLLETLQERRNQLRDRLNNLTPPSSTQDSAFYISVLPHHPPVASPTPIQAFVNAPCQFKPTLDDILAILLTHRQSRPVTDHLMQLLARPDADHFTILSGSQFPGWDFPTDRRLQEHGSLRWGCMRVLDHYGTHDGDNDSPIILKAPDAIYNNLECPWPLKTDIPLYIILVVYVGSPQSTSCLLNRYLSLPQSGLSHPLSTHTRLHNSSPHQVSHEDRPVSPTLHAVPTASFRSSRGSTAMQGRLAQHIIQTFPEIHAFLEKIWSQPRIFQDVYATYLAFQCAEVICLESRLDLSRPNAHNSFGLSVSEARRFALFYNLAPQSVENRQTWLNSFKTLFHLVGQPDFFVQHPSLRENHSIVRWIKYCTYLFQLKRRQVLDLAETAFDEDMSAYTLGETDMQDGGYVRFMRWTAMQELQSRVANIPEIRSLLQEQSLWRSAFRSGRR